MKTGRSSLLNLMGLILVVAMTMEAMQAASKLWVFLYVNGVVFLLIAATIHGRFAATRATRDWLFGFALFGWAFLLLRIAAGHQWGASQWLEEWLGENVAQPFFMPLIPFPRDQFPYTDARHKANGDYCNRASTIFLMALTLTIAYAGAWLTALLGRRARRREEA